MKKVLITSTRWGHSSIAMAVKEILEGKYSVHLEHIEVEPFSKNSYHIIYKFIPKLFRLVYFLSRFKIFRQMFNSFVEKDYKRKIDDLVKRIRPEIIINVYFAFDSSIESLRPIYNFRLINILADPWTFSKIIISENGENLTFDDFALKNLKLLIPKAKALSVGWFIEKKYHQVSKIDRKILREKLDIYPDKFTLCVVSGSEGTFNIFKILSTFLNPQYKIQVIILCGNNSEMFRVVKTLRSLSEKIRGPNIIGVAYTDSMQNYLRASDLVVGKAGPNTIFQSVATHTPFFAISHIAGQEDGNLDIINRYNIGFVEENPRLATQKLKQIIENPKTLNKFQKNLKTLSEYCGGSEKKLIKLLER